MPNQAPTTNEPQEPEPQGNLADLLVWELRGPCDGAGVLRQGPPSDSVEDRLVGLSMCSVLSQSKQHSRMHSQSSLQQHALDLPSGKLAGCGVIQQWQDCDIQALAARRRRHEIGTVLHTWETGDAV